MKNQKHLCNDCARFTSVNETDGECGIHGYTTCFSFSNCKDFIEVIDNVTDNPELLKEGEKNG